MIEKYREALPHIPFYYDARGKIRYGDGGHVSAPTQHGLSDVDLQVIMAIHTGSAERMDIAKAMQLENPRGIRRLKKYIGMYACSMGQADYVNAMEAADGNVEAAIDLAFGEGAEAAGRGHQEWLFNALEEMIDHNKYLAWLQERFPDIEFKGSPIWGTFKYHCSMCSDFHYDSDRVFGAVPEENRAEVAKFMVSLLD